jgi:hypothetical protein
VQPGADEILLHATELQGHRDEEVVLNLMDRRAPVAFAEFVRNLGNTGTTVGGSHAGRA